MYSRKRKQRTERRAVASNELGIDPALFVVAHEADIVRGPQAKIAAQSLEVVEYPPNHPPTKRIGNALLRWGGPSVFGFGKNMQPDLLQDNEDTYVDQEQEEIWLDRYDARLLLDTLPPAQSQPAPPRAESPSGWSDLPSDSEDTFFFSPNELDDYHREKRRRTIDQAREERLKARLAEDGEEEDNKKQDEEEVWGGSDEEPDDAQKELMRRTAVHLHSSPNPAQLEMRILANHGADKRFAFLRGRWSHAWRLAKYKVQLSLDRLSTLCRRVFEEERSRNPVIAWAGIFGSVQASSFQDEFVRVKGDGEGSGAYV
ncbi:hypothetical protein M378DRAFT_186945 [Amanita muscaria Koide BX008]|uniref:Uncharacterized protein n=1 Tax=Amanita muscaria (strain Koide BX008) TaxID=946122 RepID=A0A0C2WPZ6_AMAMK|nr:hypothetical protein M378DRAFT_186945 [Amanita muscaria Koide BX008]